MTYPIFFPCNLTNTSPSIPSSDVVAGFPASNLKTYNPNLPVKVNSIFNSSRVTIDFGSIQNFTYVAFTNFRFTQTISPTIQLNYSIDNFSYTLLQTIPYADGNGFIAIFPTISARYFRIDVGTGTPPVIFQVACFYAGNPFSLGFNYDFGAKINNKDYSSIVEKETLSGTLKKSQVVSGGRKISEIKFSIFNHTIKQNLLDFFEITQGSLRPFYWIDQYSGLTGNFFGNFVFLDNPYIPISWDSPLWNNMDILILKEVIKT